MQSTAMLGPGLTFAGTGNISQASISYFTSKAIEKETGMDAATLVSKKIEEGKVQKSQKRKNKNFMLFVKANFEKTRIRIFFIMCEWSTSFKVKFCK